MSAREYEWKCGHTGSGGEWGWDSIGAVSPVQYVRWAMVKERRGIRSTTIVFRQ